MKSFLGQPEEESPLFATDDFKIWCFKVVPCAKRFVHDWTVCPFAHTGEKAVRRDPRLFEYTGIACPDMKKTGGCIRADRCPYAHNVFEYWLHPTRYRTQLCNDGPNCSRGICFFAHSLDQLRVPATKPYVSPEALARASLEALQANPHPLGAQGCGPCHQLVTEQALLQSAAQAAAMAVLSAPTAGAAAAPQGYADAPCHHHRHAACVTHTPSQPPRLSQDYGALPRWSNAVGGGRAGGERGSFPMARASLERYAGSSGTGGHFADHAGRLSLEESIFAGGGSAYGGAHGLPTQQLCGGAPLPPHPQYPHSQQQYSLQQQQAPHRYSDVPELAAAAAAGPADGEDLSLAQSLASLKIAMTSQQVAASSCSNHDIVISTLHQILLGAVQAQQGAPRAGAAATGKGPTAASPDAVAAARAAGIATALGLPRSGSSGAASDAVPTPARSSLDSCVASPRPRVREEGEPADTRRAHALPESLIQALS